jgi:hypothetical protein
MNDMAIERELYMDNDSEEQISIDNENGNLPPHQELSSGSKALERRKMWGDRLVVRL